jgi:LmbE family N-acetylglucosaminyl deacetylase
MVDIAPFNHLVLSPHLDDAALSIGGTIARFTSAGEPTLVLTITAGSPPPGAIPSAFAASLHRAWGLGAAEVVALRRREDEAAMTLLGASALRLDLLDAIYRLPGSYDSEAALTGEPAAHDRLEIELAAQLARILAASPGALVLAPLAVGVHVDHRLVHRAAIDLARRGHDVAFYEDFPYASKPAAVELRRAAIGGDLQPTTLAIEATIDRKIAAILAYTSQIAYLFGDREQARSAVTRYALSVGLGAPAERVWRLV